MQYMFKYTVLSNVVEDINKRVFEHVKSQVSCVKHVAVHVRYVGNGLKEVSGFKLIF